MAQQIQKYGIGRGGLKYLREISDNEIKQHQAWVKWDDVAPTLGVSNPPTSNSSSPKLPLNWEEISNQVTKNPAIVEGSDFGRCSVSLVLSVVQDVVEQQLRSTQNQNCPFCVGRTGMVCATCADCLGSGKLSSVR